MGIYYVLLLVPMLIQHINIKGYRINYQKRNNRALVFFFFLLTLMVMLRHQSIGNDTSSYIYYFLRYSRKDWSLLKREDVEVGFVYLNKFISLISTDPQFFLAATGFAVSIMIYPTYKRLCVDASLTVVLFCSMSTFVMMFSGIRQMLAVGLGCIAYEFTRNKKLVFYVLTVLLALTIHITAFMLVFMYPLYHARITKKWLLVLLPVLAGVFVLNRQVFSFLTSIMAEFTDYSSEMSSTGAYTMLILMGAFAVFAYLIPKESSMDTETIGLRNFLLLSAVIQIFAPLHVVAMRMNYYYLVFIPLLLPKIVECRSKRWNQVAILGRHVMVVFFLAYFFLNAYRGGSLNTFPYHFYWESVR